MFGVVPKAVWSRVVAPDQENCIPLQTNCLLLEMDGNRVLIESGNGSKWSDKERTIFGLEDRTIEVALAEAGVSPDQIDLVILTHLHFDHAGGLTSHAPDGKLVSTFPSAQIVVQEQEWNDAMSNKSTMSATYLRTHLDPIADQVRRINGETTIIDGIQAIPTPGHTWGHQSILIDEINGPLCFTGDLLPTVNHVGRSWSMGYDMLPHDTLLTKERILSQAADEGWRLALDHEPGNALVTVDQDSKKNWFKLIPEQSD